MSVSLASKIAGASTLAAGAPATYFVWDQYFSLNEIENAILENNSSDWTITSQTSSTKVSATASVNVTKEGSSPATYNWECVVTGNNITTDNSGKFINYLKNKLNKDSEKQSNRKYLVKSCSKDRKDVEDSKVSTHVKAEFTLEVTTMEDNKMYTYLFGEGSTTETQ